METELPAGVREQEALFDPVEQPPPASLADRFVVPPFSVLDKRSAEWATRRRQWLSLGIQSELGRGEGLTYGISHAGWKEGERTSPKTSIFDPVLCELAYRWFSAPGDRVLDPFAGGSVRGIVASWLARNYTGIDIRREQIEANYDQLHIADVAHPPRWLLGDARDIQPNESHDEYDLVFTCPPYADLEVYSDDPRDLSTMRYDAFLREYQRSLAAAISVLRPDRYVVIVIGDARDKRSSDGRYYGLVADTINVARDIGLSLYNDMVLMTPVGSVRLTVTRQFNQSRKIGRIHQYVLVFTKGDGRRAADRLNADNEVTGPRVERDPVEESQAAEVYETPEDWWSQCDSCAPGTPPTCRPPSSTPHRTGTCAAASTTCQWPRS